MNADLEAIMTRAANNMAHLYSSEAPDTIDIYSGLELVAEKFMAQGYGESLAWEMAYAKIESENMGEK